MESTVKRRNYYKGLGRRRETYVSLLLMKDLFAFPHPGETAEEQGGV